MTTLLWSQGSSLTWELLQSLPVTPHCSAVKRKRVRFKWKFWWVNQQILQLNLYFLVTTMIKVNNNSCMVCAIQFLHFRSSQHGLAEGSCSQGSLLSQLLLFCQICDWTLNYCFLVTRDLQGEVMCYRCSVGMPCFKMYGTGPEWCWNLLATLAAGPRPLRTGCFASTQHIPARNVCESITGTLRVPFRHLEHLLCWPKVLVVLRSHSNQWVCSPLSQPTGWQKPAISLGTRP